MPNPNPFIEKAKMNPFTAKEIQPATPRERTFINRYDDPKHDGIPAEVIEHTTDMMKARRSFDAAGKNYAHRTGWVVYTEEEFAEHTKPSKPKKTPKKQPEQPKQSEEVGSI